MSERTEAERRKSARVMLWPVRAGIAGILILEILLLRQLTEALSRGGFIGRGWWQWGLTFGGLMIALYMLFSAHRGLTRMARPGQNKANSISPPR